MRIRTAFLCALVSVVVLAGAAAAEETREFPVEIFEKTLANGMKVLVLPRKGVPAVACSIVCRVGSVNELPGYTGMAHFIEHMMFKGTEKIGVKDPARDAEYRRKLDAVVAEIVRLEGGKESPESEARLRDLREKRNALFEEQKKNLELNHIFKIYRDAGGTFTNAATSNDWTAYFCMLPPEKVELFFWVEAERFRNAIFRQFHAEKDVVREERRMYENRPGAPFGEEVQRALFGSHPYAHPVLGYHEDLHVMTRGDLREFWNRFYTPDNLFFFLGGDLEPARAFALAEKYFGSFKPYEGERRRVPKLRITKKGEIRIHGSGRGKPRVRITYRVPEGGTDEELALELLASHLGDRESRLYKELVEKRKIAQGVSVSYDGRLYAGLLHVSATLNAASGALEAESEILATLEELKARPLPAEEMERLRRRYRADVLGSVKSEMRLGFMLLRREVIGSWRDIEKLLQKSKTLEAAALQKLAQEYLVRENSVVSLYTQKKIPADAVPHRPPAPKPAKTASPGKELPASWKDLTFERRPFVFPSGEKARGVLSNGMRVFLVPDAGAPSISIAARVLGGAAEDPRERTGLTSLAAAVLGEAGIPGMPGKELREKLEEMVAEMGTGSDQMGHSVSVEVFPQDIDEGLRIFFGLLTGPELEEKVFQRIQRNRIARLPDRELRAGAVAAQLYSELLWGAVHANRLSTKETLEALTLEDVSALLRDRTTPDRVILTVSGKFNPGTMKKKLETLFAGWKRGSGRPYRIQRDSNDPSSAKRGLHVRVMPTTQGTVRLGLLTVPAAHEDLLALRLFNAVLSKRIFNIVRSVHGLSYTAGSRLRQSWQYDSPLTVLFSTKCKSVPFAIDLALGEVRKLLREGPTEEEFKGAKTALDTAYRSLVARSGEAADAFARLEALGEDLEFYRKAYRRVESMDAGQVREAAARHIDIDRFLILCVGDVEKMKQGDGVHENRLADFGPLTVHQSQTPAPSGAKAVVLQLFEAVKQGDVETLKAHATKRMLEMFKQRPEFEQQMKAQGAMLKTATFSIVSEEKKDDATVLRAKVEIDMGGNKMAFSMSFRMVEEGGAWKCDGLRMGR
jgi:predicted Zn-dependent peptidase